jgi:hypothetical protein
LEECGHVGAPDPLGARTPDRLAQARPGTGPITWWAG